MEFLHLYGKASIIQDKKVPEERYVKTDDSWFKGPGDPDLSALRIDPDFAYYWDTRYNTIVSLFKMGVGAIIRNSQDISKEGSLKLK